MNKSLLLSSLLITTPQIINAQNGTLEVHRRPKLTIIPRLAVYSFDAERAQINGPVTVNGPIKIEGTLTINGQQLNPSGLLQLPLSIANGGTNATSMTNVDGVVYYDGTILNTTTVGTAGQILTSRGPGLAPLFVTGAGGSGISNIDGNTGAISGATVTMQGGNNITTSATNSTTMTIDLVAPVTIANGGTNATAMTNTDGVVYYDGTKLNTTTAGTAGQLLTSNGTGNAPTFQAFTINTPDNTSSVTGNSLTLTAAGSGSTVKLSGSGTTITLTMTDVNDNTVVGAGAGNASMTGFFNAVLGNSAGSQLTSGSSNTVIGNSAGTQLTSGVSNIIIGAASGSSLNAIGNDNICIGLPGGSGDNSTLRIGNPETISSAFISGIRGVTTGASDAIAVLIDSNGQLGTVSSSRKYKENIQDIDIQETNLLNLRPVTFNYKKHESTDIHFGLIAEEVEELIPDLVIRDKNGDAQTVKYHELPVLLLAHIKQLAAKNEELETRLTEEITELKSCIAALKGNSAIA
ncbi:MAG: tail fiber domain-containing protein [Candidatus Babeliales bacterium]